MEITRLRYVSGGTPGELVELYGRRCILGRDPGCDLVVEEGKVAREHAELTIEEGRVTLRAGAPMRVNGQVMKQLQQVQLVVGDRLQIGGCELLLVEIPGFNQSSRVLFGKLATRMELVEDEDVAEALRRQTALRDKGREVPIGELLIQMGKLRNAERDRVLQMQTSVDPSIAQLTPDQLAAIKPMAERRKTGSHKTGAVRKATTSRPAPKATPKRETASRKPAAGAGRPATAPGSKTSARRRSAPSKPAPSKPAPSKPAPAKPAQAKPAPAKRKGTARPKAPSRPQPPDESGGWLTPEKMVAKARREEAAKEAAKPAEPPKPVGVHAAGPPPGTLPCHFCNIPLRPHQEYCHTCGKRQPQWTAPPWLKELQRQTLALLPILPVIALVIALLLGLLHYTKVWSWTQTAVVGEDELAVSARTTDLLTGLKKGSQAGILRFTAPEHHTRPPDELWRRLFDRDLSEHAALSGFNIVKTSVGSTHARCEAELVWKLTGPILKGHNVRVWKQIITKEGEAREMMIITWQRTTDGWLLAID